MISLFFVCACLSGCGTPDESQYGALEDNSRSSLNGLGVHKKMWEQAGTKCLLPKRLSTRLENVDVIVLVSQGYDPPGKRARQWLENWLASGSGRKVVYFGRDFNAELQYLQETIASVPANNSPLVRLRMAKVKAFEMQERLQSYSENTFCDWFYLDTTQPNIEVSSFDGEWSEGLEANKATWPVRTRLMPPDIAYQKNPPSWITNPPKAAPGALPVAPFPFSTDDDEDRVVFRSDWNANELKDQEDWNESFENVMESRVLLNSSAEDPLIYELTDDTRLGDGKIIVVANGAPFLNGSLVNPMFAQIGERIIEECLPASRVALVGYDNSGLQISLTQDVDSRGVGIEMLVEWPLSAITIPACLMGLVVCIYLLPILGRPRTLRERSVSDFGLHVEAMGQLLRDAGDHTYARRTIAEYFRQVRNEVPPNWVSTNSNASTPPKG